MFDSLSREFVLGKKRIIVPAYAVRGEWDAAGNKKHYFDVNDEVFQAMSTSDAEELKITDNTGELRVTEHVQALGELLDLLCMQAGLSEGALSFKDDKDRRRGSQQKQPHLPYAGVLPPQDRRRAQQNDGAYLPAWQDGGRASRQRMRERFRDIRGRCCRGRRHKN